MIVRYNDLVMLYTNNYLDHIRQKKYRFSQTVCEKLITCFSIHLKNMEKEAKCLEEIQTFCPPHKEWKIRWNIATIYSRLQDPLINRYIHN